MSGPRIAGIAIFSLLVLLIAACSTGSPAQLPRHDTVAAYFDAPPPWPGQPWTKADQAVDAHVLESAGGPAHCDLQAVTFMTMGWPVGTFAATGDHARQYLRDRPQSAILAANLRGTWALDPKLPADAQDTGYRYGSVKLFVAPSDWDDYVYLVAPHDSERWPRSDPMTLCA